MTNGTHASGVPVHGTHDLRRALDNISGGSTPEACVPNSVKLLLILLMLSVNCLAQQASAPAQTDITVALDGSGQFKSVQEAIMSVSAGSPAKPGVTTFNPGTS